jgi:hypothetical protein
LKSATEMQDSKKEGTQKKKQVSGNSQCWNLWQDRKVTIMHWLRILACWTTEESSPVLFKRWVTLNKRVTSQSPRFTKH